MKIVEINSVNYGSTGGIMLSIANVARTEHHEVYTFSSCGNDMKQGVSHHGFIGNRFTRRLSKRFAFIFGLSGCFSFFATKKLLRQISRIHPDIIHLHNLHSEYINIPLLFNYIKKNKIKIVWTLHDCWAFTGHCPCFTLANCYKWQIGCYKCLQYKDYPISLFDNSRKMYALKKKWFLGVKDLTIVTPSQWLANLVKQSFLKDYPIRVIYNGVDLNVFRPLENDFRKKYNIPKEKFILLGVAFGWGKRKGLDVFIDLAKRLDKTIYQIVLVGTDDNIDKLLPRNIISIHRTQNQTELAEIYTAADLFVNPTREEVFGLVNVEANACGTPIVTFNTGGCPECFSKDAGSVVEYNNVDAMENEIIRICQSSKFTREDCIKSAKSFNINDKIQEYIDQYITF